MTSLFTCLDRAVAGGDLDEVRAQEAAKEFAALADRYATAMPRAQAEAQALRDLAEATRRSARSRRHAVINQLQSMVRIRDVVLNSRHPGRAVQQMLEGLATDGARTESVRWVHDALKSQWRFELNDMLTDTGTNVFSFNRDAPLFANVVRELHGQATTDAVAKRHAAAVRKVQQRLRQMFNAHGGDIGELDDFGMTHTHDARAIEAAGLRAWTDAVFDRLEWSRIINKETGKPFTTEKDGKPNRAAGERFLARVFDDIVTNGAAKRTPSMSVGGKELYNTRAEPRLLHFKNGDAWMDYNAQFGLSDPFSALIGGLDALSRDVALMRVLGPNPNLGLEYAIQVAQQRADLSGDPKMRAQTRRFNSRARVLLQHINGAVNEAEHEGMARFFSNVRHFNVATRLGSAILSSTTDLVTISATAAAMGRNPANMLFTATRMMSGLDIKEAATMGFVAETLADIGSSAARLTNDVVANDIFGRMSTAVIRAQGLAAWTDRLRLAVQMETAGAFGTRAEKAWGDLDPMHRNLLDRNGISPAEWDALRHTSGLYRPNNQAVFLSPFWWAEHQTVMPRFEAEALAIRFQAAIQDQLETFVPTARMRGRARWIGDNKAGSWTGEFLRSSAGFKNYAVSITMGQIALIRSLPSPQSRALYVAGLLAAMTVMGGVALQLKSLASGRDPRPMDDPKFWLAALVQGGGLGIVGDFLFSEQNRFGGGIEQTLAGPVAGLAGDVIRPVVSNTARALQGEDTFVGRDVANLVRYNTPVLSSFWPTRTAFDRLMADQLQLLLDPDAEANMRRQERNRERTFGTETWWPRASALPSRAPNFSNAMGDQ